MKTFQEYISNVDEAKKGCKKCGMTIKDCKCKTTKKLGEAVPPYVAKTPSNAGTFIEMLEKAWQNGKIEPLQFMKELVDENILTSDDIFNSLAISVEHKDTSPLIVHRMIEFLKQKLDSTYQPNWEPEGVEFE